MLVEPPWADRHDLRLRFIEHLPVIGIRLRRLDAFGGVSSPLLIGVSYRDDLAAILELSPDGVDTVAIVAAARMADDADAEFSGHGRGSGFRVQKRDSKFKVQSCFPLHQR